MRVTWLFVLPGLSIASDCFAASADNAQSPELKATIAFVAVADNIPSPELKAAIALVTAKRYPEAREALEKIVAADPRNPEACHYLGRVIIARNDNAAFDEGMKWLAKAVELEPKNAVYLGVYGGNLLQMAGRTSSISAATKGRDAMEKALTLDPNYLAARQGLFEFYQRAPWPLGSSAKAAAQLAEIRKSDPDLATILSVLSKTSAKDFVAAFKLCDEVLAKHPENYIALYHYGRAAAMSGQNLERGLTGLKRCLTIEPPSPASPSHSNTWQRIGNIEEQLKHPDEARNAYETALKLDPSNRQASDALAKLK
jgi:cytochrome c-type biogenesis protein CcmH/NrfG